MRLCSSVFSFALPVSLTASKATFKKHGPIRRTILTGNQLLSRAAKADDVTGASQPLSDEQSAKKKLFGDLEAKVESVKLLSGDNIYGFARLTFVISNTSESQTYGVALLGRPYDNLNLSNNRGDEFKATELSGIESAFERDGRFFGQLTDIPPKSAITVISKSQVRWTGKPGEYRPYRLQTTVIFAPEVQGRYPDMRKYNLVTDIK